MWIVAVIGLVIALNLSIRGRPGSRAIRGSEPAAESLASKRGLQLQALPSVPLCQRGRQPHSLI